MSIKRLSIFALVALASCGGGGFGPDSDAAYQQAVSAANNKESEARTAGTASPCAAAIQCRVLTFQSPTPTCPGLSYKPYSLVSPTAAAASAAASEQNVLARQSLALAPPSNGVCTAVVPPVPVLSCVANTCGA